jgi:tetratricopeptide (TPR) repeat protein
LNNFAKVLLIVLVTVLLAGSVLASKKPANAYISSAKIEILSGDLARYRTAIDYLDSLFYYYGPHAEGLFWMNQIMVDLISKTANLQTKKGYVEKMTAYADSLHLCCEDGACKDKYRKDCKDYITKSDSTLEYFWRELYNRGVEQLKQLESVGEDLKNTTDSVARTYFVERKEALIDSAILNLQMAVIIDSADPKPYLGLSSVYKYNDDFETANSWLVKALDKTVERGPLLQELAYNYVRMDKYCEAAPYLREYVDGVTLPENAADSQKQGFLQTLYHLTVCYNNCGMYDSASVILRRMLEIDSTSVEALRGMGRYHNQMARMSSDSVNYYRKEGNEAAATRFGEARDAHFDTAQTFLGKVFELSQDDPDAAEEYGIVAYLNKDWQAAANAFQRVTELKPTVAENWTTLGDCYINLSKLDSAVNAYEHVVELQPNNKKVLETLKDLYHDMNKTKKEKEIADKLKSL